jgi:putative peptidoglycan lipid II flippase
VAETLRSSGRLTVAVLTSRVLGVVREAIFAALFGAGALADAYQVAFRIPNLLRDLFAEGALSSAFVPTFTAALVQDGRDRAYVLGNLAAAGALLVTGGLSLLGVVFAEQVVHAISGGFGGDVEKLELATRLTRIMMPLLALVSLGAVWMGMLNAQKRFLPPAYAPAMFNVVSIVVGVGLLLAGRPAEQALFAWSVGTLVAGAVQALFQVPALWRMGWRPAARVVGLFRDPGIRRIARLMGPAILGLAAIQINIFVNTRFAADLGDGPVAQLAYAFRLFYLPIGMFGVALATVTTTRVAEDAARGDREGLADRAAEGVSAGWMLASASAVGLLVLAEPVVGLLYERGAFTAEDTSATAVILQMYLLGLVPYSLVKILAPSFYSVDRPRTPMMASACAVAVNITFNYFTYRQLGAPGIALGTALGALANLLILRVAFGRQISALQRPGTSRRLGALLLGNAVLAAAVLGAWHLASLALASLAGGTYQIGVALSLLVVILLGFFVYVGVLRMLSYPGATLLWSLPARLLRRRSTGQTKQPP